MILSVLNLDTNVKNERIPILRINFPIDHHNSTIQHGIRTCCMELTYSEATAIFLFTLTSIVTVVSLITNVVNL